MEARWHCLAVKGFGLTSLFAGKALKTSEIS